MSFHVTYNFVQGYDNGQKKIVASEMDQNFSDVEGAINTLQTSSVDLTNAQTISGNKTFTGTVDLSGATVISSDNIPVGSIIWSANASVPAGYLLCNGSAVGRATYPELFAAIGTAFGSGDGSTTFNLPNLIDRFIEGGNSAGTVKSAGLPNITGNSGAHPGDYTYGTPSGAFTQGAIVTAAFGGGSIINFTNETFDASRSSAIYGNSTTVQPPAVTALPCIKAFASVVGDATVVAGQLVNEIQSKVALDGSNTASIGSTLSTYMAHAAMPSGQYEELTVPAANGTVQAPADGWIEVTGVSTAANAFAWVSLKKNDISWSSNSVWKSSSAAMGLSACVPVNKNEQVAIGYGNTSISYLRFYYANGSATA